MTIKLIIADDHTLVRQGLRQYLEMGGDIEVVGEASTGTEVMSLLENGPRPDVALIDLRMPEMDGLELQQRLIERGLNFPLIVITGHGEVPLAVRAMKAGAVDFIEKPFASEAILDSLDMALARLAAPNAQDPAAVAAATKLALLSPREREVLEGLLAGLPNKTIAYDLAISPRTVEIHRARVMDKMGARSLSELIRLALAAGVRPSSQ